MKNAWLCVLLLPVGAVACEANLQFGCEDGSCTSSDNAASVGSGVCIPISNDPDKHGFPDDVYEVLKTNCWQCHGDPLQNGAPHTFLHYNDTLALYLIDDGPPAAVCNPCAGDFECLTTKGCVTWASQMARHAVQDPSRVGEPGAQPDGRIFPTMPFGKEAIPVCQQQILATWVASCGSRSERHCAKGTGSPSGAGGGGAGGMGSTSSTSSASSASSSSDASSSGAGG